MIETLPIVSLKLLWKFDRNRYRIRVVAHVPRMSPSGHNRKSVMATRMSVVRGKAEVDFGRLEVCF
jgi:hypothetical protein